MSDVPTSNTLLIVDDEVGVLEAYRAVLEQTMPVRLISSRRVKKRETSAPQQVWRLLFAKSGEGAVELVRKERAEGRWIAGGFFDMKMPGGIDGLETIHRAREIDPWILCTICTAYQDRTLDDIGAVFPAGADDEWDYLAKPFSPQEILKKANAMLSGWARRRRQQSDLERAEGARQTLGAKVEARDKELADLRAGTAERERLAAIGELAAGVAHEINNPLAWMKDNLEELRSTAPQGDLAEVVESLAEGLSRISKIASDMKRLSRKDEDEPVAVGLARVIQVAISLTAPAHKHCARVEAILTSDARVRGKEGRLIQVFTNLVSNAGQAVSSKDGGRGQGSITIRGFEAGPRMVIEVADDGGGIPPENLARIWEPFFTTKPRGVGTGLGLPLVKQIVEDHGGTITATSTPGAGATFRVELPKWVEAKKSPPPPAAKEPEPKARQLRVLAVDDEPMMLVVLQIRLSRRFDVTVARSLEEAIQRVDERPELDLILCDLHLGDGGGDQLHAHLAAHHPQLTSRFAVMSGGACTPETEIFLEGFRGPVLEKPVDFAALDALFHELAA